MAPQDPCLRPSATQPPPRRAAAAAVPASPCPAPPESQVSCALSDGLSNCIITVLRTVAQEEKIR